MKTTKYFNIKYPELTDSADISTIGTAIMQIDNALQNVLVETLASPVEISQDEANTLNIQGWTTISQFISDDNSGSVYYSVPLQTMRYIDGDSNRYVCQRAYIGDSVYYRETSVSSDEDEDWEDIDFTGISWEKLYSDIEEVVATVKRIFGYDLGYTIKLDEGSGEGYISAKSPITIYCKIDGNEYVKTPTIYSAAQTDTITTFPSKLYFYAVWMDSDDEEPGFYVSDAAPSIFKSFAYYCVEVCEMPFDAGVRTQTINMEASDFKAAYTNAGLTW